MIVVTIARRPVSEPTVAANVLKHGCGAMNIDATRIAAPGEVVETHSRSAEASKPENRPVYGEYRSMDTHQTPGQALGRWPANLVIGHLPGCVPRGTAKVQSPSGVVMPHHRRYFILGGHGIYHGNAPSQNVRPTCYVAPDGTETVEVWDCAAGCPVAALDAQSGMLRSGTGAVKRSTAAEHDGNRGTAYGAESRPEGTPMLSYGDAGGASRFFKVVRQG